MSDLELRIERLESRHELADLVATYCAAIDAKDVEALTQLFTREAQFNNLDGPSAIGSFFSVWMAEQGPSFHVPHTHVVQFITRDEATGIVTAHAEQRKGDAVWVMGIRYEDVYRREGGRWKFARRDVGYRYRVESDEYSRHFGEVHR